MVQVRTSIGATLCFTICILTCGCVRAGFDSSRPDDGAPARGDAGLTVDANLGDTSLADASLADAVNGAPSVTVSNLRVDWATPNWISWRWDANGEGAQLRAYELVVGTSATDVVNRNGSARIWTDADNPELAAFFLPQEENPDQVLWTRTHGHVPNQLYFGQLVAIDAAGRRSLSSIAQQRTAQLPSDGVVILSEGVMPGFSLPAAFERSSVAPYQGTYHYQYPASCADARCGENLRRSALSLALPGLTGQAHRNSAYVELALSSSAPTVSWWTTLWIWCTNGCDARISGWTVGLDSAYSVLQFPLRALQTAASAPLSFAEISGGIDSVNFFGGKVDSGVTIRVDEARIRW